MKYPRATAELLSGFHKMRILHFAAAGDASPPEMLERLRRHDRYLDLPALNRLLLRMKRNGWLASKGPPHSNGRPAYSLTPTGRAALNVVRKRLKNLREIL